MNNSYKLWWKEKPIFSFTKGLFKNNLDIKIEEIFREIVLNKNLMFYETINKLNNISKTNNNIENIEKEVKKEISHLTIKLFNI